MRLLNNRLVRSLIPLRYPETVLIDTCSACSASCFYCLHQRKRMVKPEMMDIDTFKRITHALAKDHVKTVCLYQAGEPFLNKSIYDFIAETAEFGMNSSIATKLYCQIDHAKLNDALCRVNRAKQKAEFVFTVDSVRQFVMDDIAPGINILNVIENLRRMSKLQTIFPCLSIRVSTIVNRLNEPELPEIRYLMSDLGLKWTPEGFGYYMADYAGAEDIKFVQSMIPAEKKYQRLTEKKTDCPYPMMPVIDAHGDVSICCHDMLHITKLGNVLEAGNLRKVIDSEPFQSAHRASIKRELNICRSCN